MENFFVEYFGFLFDNTSQCYLNVCISLPLLFIIYTYCLLYMIMHWRVDLVLLSFIYSYSALK